MAISQHKLVVKENKSDSAARFFLSYSKKRSSFENKELSYDILSALKKTNPVVMEIDSSICILPTTQERENFALDTLKAIRELGIDYRYQKSESKTGGKSFLDLFGIGRNCTNHKILALIPDQVWRQDAFQSLLPLYGVRYYICSEPIDGSKLLDDLYCGRILEDEINAVVPFIIFDCVDFGQMGINTVINKAELQTILGI